MRILVFPVAEGIREVTVLPGPSKLLAPIMIRGSNREEVLQAVLGTVKGIKGETPFPEG